MTATTPVAREEILDIIRGVLPALPGVVVKWQGVDTLEPPGGDVDWMRVSVEHDPDTGGQASLAAYDGQSRRWRNTGTVTVQCFGLLATTSILRALEMACAVRDAFRGRATVSGVWFRKPAVREVGPDKFWYQANTTIFFEYDEVK